jgi:hypothetical protein
MLEKEFQYYLDHQDELVQKYNNRVLVIRNNEIVGDYSTMEEAYLKSQEKYELGTFLIQKCSPGDKDYTLTFHSRVSFA